MRIIPRSTPRSTSVWAIRELSPVMIALAQIAAIVLLARYARRPGLDRGQTLVTTAITGLALALTTLLIGLALGIRLPTEALSGIHRINAVTGLAIVVALIVGFAGSFLARDVRLAGVHPSHLAHTFRARLGTSVGEYVRRLRVEWAAERLGDSDAPISAIAIQAGFSDQSHLTREMVRRLGVSPARLRSEGRT